MWAAQENSSQNPFNIRQRGSTVSYVLFIVVRYSIAHT